MKAAGHKALPHGVIELERRIAAPPEIVFAYFTDPERYRLWQGVDILSGAIVLGVAIGKLSTGVGVVEALAFAGALALGGVMIYCFWLVLTTGAFWLVQIDQIVELFQGVYQTGRWPVTVYPGWLRFGLTFLVPIAFAVTVPAEAVTRLLTGDTLLIELGFAVFLFAFTRWFWGVGVRRYSGASA